MENRPRRPDDDYGPAFPDRGGNVTSLRLEDIGDLHYEASTFSTALDYYQRIISDPAAEGLDPVRMLVIFRKSIDAALNLGDLDRAELFLNGAFDWLENRLDVDGEDRRRLIAPILGCQASLYSQRGAYRDALQVCKQAFTVLAVTDNHREVANLQVTMGICHHRLGRPDKAEEFYTDALATFRRIDDELGMAILYKNLAVLAKNACRWGRALELQRRAIELTSAHGATHLLCRLHLNEGIILRKSGRHVEARGCFEKCIRLARSLGDMDRQAKASLALGQLEMLDGHLLRAEELVLTGKNLSDQFGYLRESIIADEYLGDILQARGDYDRALYNYGIGLDKTRQIGQGTDLEGELLRRIAEAQLAAGRHDLAATSARRAIEVCERCGELYELGFCRAVLAQSLDALGDGRAADEAYRRAVAVFREQRLPRLAVRVVLTCLESRGEDIDVGLVYDMRRHLVEALADEELTADEALYCALLEGLTRAQLRLGEVDEALLSVSELDRAVSVSGDATRTAAVNALRHAVETAMVGDDGAATVPFATFGGPVSAVRLAASVDAFLASALARAGALAGCVVLSSAATVPRFAGRGLDDRIADDLETWYFGDNGQNPYVPRIVTRVDTEPALLAALGAAASTGDSALLVPIALPGKYYGFLFLLIHPEHEGGRPMFRPSLEFLTASAGFLASGLSEAERNLPVEVGAKIDTTDRDRAFDRIITNDAGMLELLEVVRKVAASDLTVLLQGETGTGKGLLAHSIHELSRRREQRFQSINCAAIPESLLESELFGHVKGSFTGAYCDKKGLVEEAAGGTVFLDEIGKLPLAMQGKLLHFIDTHVIRPVGANLERCIDVRIVCATKSDLHEQVERGDFLEDLYYRLLDFPVNVPPLRERRGDIRLLVPHFITGYCRQVGIDPPGCTSAFMDVLENAAWEGNVRELVKMINRAIVLAHGEPMLRLEHLPRAIGGEAGSDRHDQVVTPLKETLGLVEAREIAKALKRSGGNKAEVSRVLGISYPNLLSKIRKYDIRLS